MTRRAALALTMIGLAVPALVSAACSRAPAPASGSPLPASAAPLADGAADVLLTPGGVAWTATSDTIERSTDSGRTWQRELHADAACSCFGPAYFIGARDAWDLQDRPDVATRVVFTDDGGGSWLTGGPLPGERALRDADPFKQLDFADDEHGWVLGYGLAGPSGSAQRLTVVLWQTSDAGRAWRRIGGTALPESGRSVLDVNTECGYASSLGMTFTSDTTGWLTGNACGGTTPLLWRTSDGGAHWQRVTVPAPAAGWPKGAAVDVQAPVFSSASDGLLPVTTGPGRLLVYRTADGGSDWTLASSVSAGSAARPSGLVVIGARRWALPVTDGLLVTGDAGGRWHLVASGVDVAGLVPLSVLPDGTGLAEGGPPAGTWTYPYVAYRTADGGRTWAPAGQLSWLFGQKRPSLLTGVTRTGAGTGIRYGPAGIGWTSDGGRHWAVAARTVGLIQSASLASSGRGIAIGPVSALVTGDGGQRWTPGTEPAFGPLTSVQMVAGSVGFGTVCAGPGAADSAVLRTGDGGRSWRVVRLPRQLDPNAPVGASGIGPCGAPRGMAVCFATPRAGYYMSRPAGLSSPIRLYRTADGGRTWHVGAPLPRGIVGIASCAGGAAWLIAAAGEPAVNESPYAVFRSADGGHRWHEVIAPYGPRPSRITRAPLPSLAVLDVLGPRVASLVGACNNCGTVAVLLTTDGGATWTRPGGASALVPGLAQVLGASFSDHRHGWILGLPGFSGAMPVLLSTSDGGVSWQRLR